MSNKEKKHMGKNKTKSIYVASAIELHVLNNRG